MFILRKPLRLVKPARLDRLDLAVMTVIAILLLAIGDTIAQWQLRARPPRIVYLGPVDAQTQNLYVVDPASSATPQPLTDSQDGILGYDVTPDGRKIVYSEVIYTEGQNTGTTRLSMLDVPSGKSTSLYDCKDASCTGLAWRSDGGAFAFQRVDVNTSGSMGPGSARIWIFDLAADTAHPLFTDTQRVGYMPRWSPDGTQLALFSVSEGGIVIHNFTNSKDTVIPASQGQVGRFSPDGKWFYFPKVTALGDGNYGIHLALVDVSTEPFAQHDLELETEPVSDAQAAWRPDSKAMIVARLPPQHKTTQGPRLYSIDIATGAATPLVTDDTYDLDNISVAGDSVLFQRVTLGEAVARPEIWTYNLTSRELKHVASKGIFPRWLP